jgi:glutamate synthase (NADPH/NADH) large chain
MKDRYLKNLKLLNDNNVFAEEHDACGVGFVASMNGKARRDVIINGINALKAVWHRGAVDADGKTGDGAGMNKSFLKMIFIFLVGGKFL